MSSRRRAALAVALAVLTVLAVPAPVVGVAAGGSSTADAAVTPGNGANAAVTPGSSADVVHPDRDAVSGGGDAGRTAAPAGGPAGNASELAGPARVPGGDGAAAIESARPTRDYRAPASIPTGNGAALPGVVAPTSAPDCSTVGYNGSGTVSDPWRVKNASQLQCMGNSSTVTDLNDNFTQVADVDLTNTSTWYGGSGFKPIGDVSAGFAGSFDGNGYVIRNLTIDRPGEYDVGLFGFVDTGGTVTNATLVGVDVSGDTKVGALVGNLFEATITNASASGEVSGDYRVGGLVGTIGDSTVTDVSAAGNVSGNVFVGGLAGGTFNAGTVRNASVSANVSGRKFVGGLLGRNYYLGSVRDASASGDVSGDETVGGLVGVNNNTLTNVSASGNVSGGDEVGGLVGQNGELDFGFPGTVRRSEATGNVSGNDEVGGLVGVNAVGTVSRSAARGDVTGNATSDRVGGLVGNNSATVENATASGEVSGRRMVGGLVGGNGRDAAGTAGRVSQSNATGNVSGAARVGGLVGANERGVVTESSARGDVGTATAEEVGGLVGNNSALVNESYARGDVTGDTDVGGLVGRNGDGGDPGTVNETYATGAVSGNFSVGGLVGFNDAGDLNNSYWDVNATGQSSVAGGNTGSVANNEGLTTPEMTYDDAPGNMTAFEFTTTWTITALHPILDGQTAGNAGPTARADTYETDINVTLSVPAPGVLGNDTDPEADPLGVAEILTPPSNGTVSVGVFGDLQYTPDPGFNGTDSFTYRMGDAYGANYDTATVTVDVNDPPVARNDSYAMNEGSTLVVNTPGVLGNDSDPEGDSLAAAVVDRPANGTLDVAADGSFRYAPAAGFTGTDSFTYEAGDGSGTDTATVTVDVTENRANLSITIDNTTAPVVRNDTLRVNATVENVVERSVTQPVTLSVGGVQRDATTVSLAPGATTTVTLTWTTGPGDAGNHTAAVETDSTADAVGVTVQEPGSFAVAIDATNAPVNETETLSVTARIENTGDFADTQTVVLTVGGIQRDTASVSLDPGNGTTTTFTWATTEGDGGHYLARVDSANDTARTGVTVRRPARFNVSVEATTSPIVVGGTLRVNATVTNEGNQSGNKTVTLAVGGAQRDSTTVALAPGANASVSLTWNTSSGDAGSYTAAVASPDTADATPVTVQESGDFAVSIDTTNSPVTETETLEVTATITNTGDTSETQTVVLTVGGTQRDSKTVTLAGGASTTRTFNWTTSVGDAGNYTAAVEAANSTDTTGVTVQSLGALRVSIDGTNSPVDAGETLLVNATITNAGDVSETQNVTLSVGGTVRDSVTLSLGPGNSTTRTFEWATSSGDADTYTATVATRNDSETTGVTVLGASYVDVQITSTSGPVLAGDTLAVTATVTNRGDVNATRTVTLVADGGQQDSVTVTLSPGEAATVTLSWATGGDDAGSRTVGVDSADGGDVTVVGVQRTVAASGASDACLGDEPRGDDPNENSANGGCRRGR